MADISVERKPRSPLGLILGLLLLAAIAAGVWWFMSRDRHDAPAAPAAEAPAATTPPANP